MSIILYELAGADRSRPFSPHCWKVAFALAHKALDFRTEQAGFTEVPAIENGFSRTLPVLRDGDRLVSDSFAIAEHLEDSYPDRPTLFGGPGGRAAARFVERWSQLTVHGFLGAALLPDILAMLGPEDAVYFRASRENRFGKSLEDAFAGRETRLPAFRAALEPLRSMLAHQPFLGGETPLFADHIVAGAFMWARTVSPLRILEEDDPVAAWFGRCLERYAARRPLPAAA